MSIEFDPKRVTKEDLTAAEKTILGGMARLYWLLTQSSSVARYPSDVRYFGEVQKLVTDNQQEIDKIEQLIRDYESETKR
jgi:hypothetical protein